MIPILIIDYIPIQNMNWLVSLMDTDCVLCEAGGDSVYRVGTDRGAEPCLWPMPIDCLIPLHSTATLPQVRELPRLKWFPPSNELSGTWRRTTDRHFCSSPLSVMLSYKPWLGRIHTLASLGTFSAVNFLSIPLVMNAVVLTAPCTLYKNVVWLYNSALKSAGIRSHPFMF